ncbi:MAG TPA: GMC family oxidoreductase [Methylotenera sp.]|nr:GMC family oxidoreductase [Methylotenera sp.]HPH06348.1 GMC family oxidoreductase [Methylotenera sp.]HPN00833.1 GMC family oxidoreductase [Methylotenera sp.]
MFIDLNSVSNNSIEAKSYDFCICGAGPSGITLARKLATLGKTVALLEGGALEYTEESQEIYRGQSLGLNNWEAITNCRLRYFGGTSNHWGGRCSFFDKIDFEQRELFAGMSGWPAGSHQKMFKHLQDACEIVDIPRDSFKALPKSHWKGDFFRLSERAFSPPTRFRTKYIEELKRSEKIDLYINANLTDIRLHDALSAVSYFEVKNFHGKAHKFSAKHYVIAAGASETAKLLLNFNKQLPQGIGNQHDMVGRCFMEHFNVNFGNFVVEDHLLFKEPDLQFTPSETFMRKFNIGNAVLDFDANVRARDFGRLKELKKSAREFVCQSETMTNIARNFAEFDCEGDGVISSLIEQVPNMNSRITLNAEKDHFGLRRVTLNWQASPADDMTIRHLGREIAKELARTKVARIKLKDFILDDNIPIDDYGHHCHQMGTTRMSIDPKNGVVDANQKVHGIDNLYIAGASVYPTGGGCNPTLTLLMMTLGLGEYLAKL